MTETGKPSFRRSICPVCGGGSVIRNEKVLGIRAPKFSCPDCGAGLTTTPTLRVLWAFAAAFIGIPAAFLLISWLQGSLNLSGALLAATYGGLMGGVSSYAFKLALDGLVFKPWRAGSI